MNKYKTVLAVGAHPDDVEFSCLGFLMRLKQLGAELTVFIASNGSDGDPTSGAIRLEESGRALACVSPELIVEDTAGIKYADYEKIAVKLRRIILDRSPDLILIHSEHDTHQEHLYIREMLLTATRRIPCTILSYKSVSVTASYRENFFVDVSEEIEAKINCLSAHVSQAHHEYMSPNFIRQFHVSWFARMRGFEFVESYYLEQTMI